MKILQTEKKFQILSYFLLLLLFLSAKISFSQTTYWAKLIESPLSEVIHSIVLFPNQDFLLVGWTNNISSETENLLLIYCDKNGNIIWQKSLGGSLLEVGLTALPTSDGNILVGGTTSSFGQGSSDIWLIKMTQTGNILWQRTYGGYDDESISQLIETNEKGFILAGWTYSFGNGSHDALVFKIDSLGNLQWAKAYGGKNSEDIRCFTKTKNGNILITGITNDSVYQNVMWCALIDTSGNILKQVKFYDTKLLQKANSFPTSITGYVYPTNIFPFNNYYLITGVTLSYFNSGKAPFLIVIDDSLDIVSATTFDVNGYISHSTIDDDNIFFTGFSNITNTSNIDLLLGSIKFSDLTFKGVLLGGNEGESGFFPTIFDDSTLLVAGYSYSFSNGNSDILLLKISKLFNLPVGEVKVNETFQNIPPFTITNLITAEPLDFKTINTDLIVSYSDANVNNINMTTRELNGVTSVNSFDAFEPFIISTFEQIIIILPEESSISDISIQNILGQEIHKIPEDKFLGKKSITFSITDIPSGVYFIVSNSFRTVFPFVKL